MEKLLIENLSNKNLSNKIDSFDQHFVNNHYNFKMKKFYLLVKIIRTFQTEEETLPERVSRGNPDDMEFQMAYNANKVSLEVIEINTTQLILKVRNLSYPYKHEIKYINYTVKHCHLQHSNDGDCELLTILTYAPTVQFVTATVKKAKSLPHNNCEFYKKNETLLVMY